MMGGRDHSCPGCGNGGFANDLPCDCPPEFHTAPPATPTEGEMERCRWMIYVCPDCGDNCELTSGSEHGFFGSCHACEVGWIELDAVEVVPASELERCRQERDEWERRAKDWCSAAHHFGDPVVVKLTARAEAAEAHAARLKAAIREALDVPDNNRYGQASDPGSVLRETRDILNRALASGEEE